MSTLTEQLVEAVDGVLAAAGLANYDAAIVIVRVPHGTGSRVMSAHVGAPDVLQALLEEEKTRLAPGIITAAGRAN